MVSGNVEVKINDEIFKLTEGMAITVPAGTQHHLYNRSASDAFIFTTYSAPEYPLAEEQV